MKYRKKPVEIEALLWDGKQLSDTPKWICDALNKLMPIGYDKPTGAVMRFGNDVHISSLEGVVICEPGNYIIQGVMGELYTRKADIFALTYDKL